MKKKHTAFWMLLGALLFIPGLNQLQAKENNTETRTPKKTTTVYKIINPDGSISFSDEPQDNAEKMEVAPITTVPAINIKKNHRVSQTSKPVEPGSYYQKLTISNPSNGAAFHSGESNIPVNVEVEPNLKYGDAFVLLLDGKIVATQREQAFNLKHVPRGTHELELKIIDLSKKTIKSTTSKFTLHRPKI